MCQAVSLNHGQGPHFHFEGAPGDDGILKLLSLHLVRTIVLSNFTCLLGGPELLVRMQLSGMSIDILETVPLIIL